MGAKPRVRSSPSRLKRDAATFAELEELGEIQCTHAEVAAIFGASDSCLAQYFRNYADGRRAYEAGKARGSANLRRAQLKLAQSNASMAIILGKAYLGQAERREADESGAFDVEAAAERVRRKLAAIIDAPEAPGDRQSH